MCLPVQFTFKDPAEFAIFQEFAQLARKAKKLTFNARNPDNPPFEPSTIKHVELQNKLKAVYQDAFLVLSEINNFTFARKVFNTKRVEIINLALGDRCPFEKLPNRVCIIGGWYALFHPQKMTTCFMKVIENGRQHLLIKLDENEFQAIDLSIQLPKDNDITNFLNDGFDFNFLFWGKQIYLTNVKSFLDPYTKVETPELNFEELINICFIREKIFNVVSFFFNDSSRENAHKSSIEEMIIEYSGDSVKDYRSLVSEYLHTEITLHLFAPLATIVTQYIENTPSATHLQA